MTPTIPQTMLAAQVVEFNKPYKIHSVPTPGKELFEHDMLVKIGVASLCHTDSMVRLGLMGTKLPCTGSHEGAGTVAKIGSAVTNFKVGDRVLCNLIYHRCRTCKDCTGPERYSQYCTNVGGHLGVTIDGSFAEYEVVDARECCHLPDNVSFQSAAALACAGATDDKQSKRMLTLLAFSMGRTSQSRSESRRTIAIVGGGGGLGHLGIQFAKALGLQVIAIDARDEGLALARESGADIVIDARQGKQKLVEEAQRVTTGEGASATLNVSDHESAAAISAAVTKMHGTLVQIAQPPNVSVPFRDIVFRDIRIHGSLICSRGELQKMVEIVAKHNVKVKTNAFQGLKELPKAVELAQSGKRQGKPVILVDLEAIENEKKTGVKMV